jgi:two-component system nitrate/nitrite sensor histidine kinase NarX
MPILSTVLPWVLVILGAGAAAGSLWYLQRERKTRRATLDEVTRRLQETEKRLSAVLQLNRELASASDEKTLVEAALSVVSTVTESVGASFVPFDAWGQPMPAFTFGHIPPSTLESWGDHLLSPEVQSRCTQCHKLQALTGEECPLKQGPFSIALSVYCFPLIFAGHPLGIFNLYLPVGRSLSDELRSFLESLFDEVSMAVESVRLHHQEVETLRTLHTLPSSRHDLVVNLTQHFDSIRNALHLEGILLQLRPLPDSRLSELRILSGNPEGMTPPGLVDQLVQNGLLSPPSTPQPIPGTALSWRAFPLLLPEGQNLGVILVFTHQPALLQRQELFFHTLAAQTAWILENERLTRSLEYLIIVQERSRLAREIHDGLAQTLAFLKMHSAQMQSALAQGDIHRLNALLQESKQVIAEAYQEIRQAIDNLRVQPDGGMQAWLRMLAESFEKNTGLPVQVDLPPETINILPEVQAQLVRITQEALNNVRKHAHASRVTICLREWCDQLIFEISDDGQGFDPEDLPTVAQHGLRGMRERAELIGADFQIISQPRRGATVRLLLPHHVLEAAS